MAISLCDKPRFVRFVRIIKLDLAKTKGEAWAPSLPSANAYELLSVCQEPYVGGKDGTVPASGCPSRQGSPRGCDLHEQKAKVSQRFRGALACETLEVEMIFSEGTNHACPAFP